MKIINTIEDIYPMTIIRMRHGKFAIVESYCNCDCTNSLEGDEECQYDPHHFMKEKWAHINYGIGKTIDAAFIDFKIRFKK